VCTGAGAGSGSGEGSEGSREGLGGFGAVWEALVQSQVRFNGVPKKVPTKVSEKV